MYLMDKARIVQIILGIISELSKKLWDQEKESWIESLESVS